MFKFNKQRWTLLFKRIQILCCVIAILFLPYCLFDTAPYQYVTNRILMPRMLHACVYEQIQHGSVDSGKINPQMSSTTLTAPSKTKHVLIYTRYRSGSSFVGELFNSHPNVFYIFEFIKFLRKNNANRSVYRNSLLVESCLDDVTSCKFSAHTDDMPAENSVIDTSWRDRALCSKLDNYDSCSGLATRSLECFCAHHQYKVTKEISMTSLQVIHNILESERWKVIHLVRDPRGIISSRIKIQEIMHPEMNYKYISGSLGAKYVAEAKQYCQEVVEDKQYHSEHQLLIGQSYKRVRYEDLAQDPDGEARELYRFVGIPFHNDVSEWISKSTVKDTSWTFSSYDTTRNSISTAVGWLKHLPMGFIQRIQYVCHDMLVELNYRILTESDDLQQLTIHEMI